MTTENDAFNDSIQQPVIATDTTYHIKKLMQSSGVPFGTSGARGQVIDMTDRVCYTYTLAFLQYLHAQGVLQTGDEIGIAGDLRHSTPRIMNAVARAINHSAYQVVNCGRIPSPAVAYYGLHKSIPTIMVTGSHIPDDRNGIKFNKADGEILKADEQGISSQRVTIKASLFDDAGAFVQSADQPVADFSGQIDPAAEQLYLQRYQNFFRADALNGMKVGLYEHSGVGRDILHSLLTKLGATVIALGRSDTFIPVDTEAIREEDITLARTWTQQYSLDAIVSTDGDADRPLVGTETGEWLRGDIAGILCALYLGVNHIVTPVSSNSAVEKCGRFKSVTRTKIGSPYVIAGMQQVALADKQAIVAGYEANGGFLLATDVQHNGKQLAALPTRDAAIVILSILVATAEQGKKISDLLNSLPKRFTASNRLKDFPTELSKQFINSLVNEANNDKAIEAFFGDLCGQVKAIDLTDGLRIHFNNNEIIHLRASGNAPEFRCYNEADSAQRVAELNSACMKKIASWSNKKI